jgi:Xaa-Pro aminopeptidase
VIDDKRTRTMPYNWSALDDGTPRPVPQRSVPDEDLTARGRELRHVYPAAHGPHNPNLGHAIGMMKMPLFNVSSHNTDRMEPGMAFVLHAQWLEPLSAGCNVGDCYLVTEDGFENLSRHTPLDPFRVSV